MKKFEEWSSKSSAFLGKPFVAIVAITTIVIWAISGPIFGFSEGWMLIINTITTIVTYLMVFFIQNSENRNSMAIQAKLDELIQSIDPARNELIKSEDLPEADLKELRDSST